jgi:hypothetical protein
VAHQLAGALQPAKGVNLIAAAAAFGVVYGLAVRLGLTIVPALAVAAAAAANPIAEAQALTFYLEGLAASLLTMLVAGLAALAWSNRRSDLLVPALALPLLLNLKFSVTAMVAFLCIAAAVIVLLRFRRDGVLNVACLGAVGVASVVALALVPYMQNLIDYGHPFYPLMGPDRVVIMPKNFPASLADRGPLAQFVFGTFGVLERGTGQVLGPWNLSLQVLQDAGITDHRVGGFGVLFWIVALVTLITLIVILRSDALSRGSRAWLMVALAVLAASVAIHPENWWARYVPQLWLIPVAVAATALTMDRQGPRRLGGSLLAIILANAAITAAAAANSAWLHHLYIGREREIIAQEAGGSIQVSAGPFPGVWYRLVEAGIDVELVPDPDDLACPAPKALAGGWGDAVYCPRWPEPSAPAPARG